MNEDEINDLIAPFLACVKALESARYGAYLLSLSLIEKMPENQAWRAEQVADLLSIMGNQIDDNIIGVIKP